MQGAAGPPDQGQGQPQGPQGSVRPAATAGAAAGFAVRRAWARRSTMRQRPDAPIHAAAEEREKVRCASLHCAPGT